MSNPQSVAQDPVPSRKPRGRGKLLLAGAAVLAVAAAGVGPLPSYVVRWRVLPQLQSAFDNRLTVEDWSANWVSGLTLHNVKLADAAGGEAIFVATLRCDLSPWKAVSGQYALGQATAAGARLHLQVRPDGSTNFDSLFQGSNTPLLLSATLDAAITQATLDLPGGLAPVTADGGHLAATLDTAGQPLTHQLDLHVGSGQLSVKGKSTLFAGGRLLDPSHRNTDQTVTFQNVPVRTGALAAGPTTGELRWTADGSGTASLQGTLQSPEISVAHPFLRGDTLRLRQVSFPVDLRRSVSGQVAVERLGIESAEAKASVTGEVTPQSLANLLHALPPEGTGKVHLTATVTDLPAVVAQLSHTLNLARDVRVTAGHLAHDLTATWTAGSLTFSSTSDFAASGKNGDRDVSLAPITLTLRATAKPGESAAGLPDLSGLAATLASPFMTLDAAADSLASVHATGSVSLDKLAEQLGQFVDLSGFTASGTGKFEITTGGSLTDPARPLGLRTTLTLDSVKLLRAGSQPLIDEPHLELAASTQFDRSRPTPADRFRELNLHLRSRSGTVDAVGASVAALDFTADVDLATLRQQASTFVDLGPIQAGGRAKIQASAHGDLARPETPLSAKLSVRVTDASLSGLPRLAPIANTPLAFDASADQHRDATGTLTQLTSATTTLLLGNAANPTLHLIAAGDLDVPTLTLPRFDVTRLSADIPALRLILAPLLPPTHYQIPKGQATATLVGSWDGRTLTLPKPATVELKDFSFGPVGFSEEGLPVRNESLTLTAAGQFTAADGFGATLSAFSVASSSKLLDARLEKDQPLTIKLVPARPPVVTGTLSLSADAARLGRLVQPVLNTPFEPLGPQARIDGLASVAANAADRSQSVDADLKLSHITVPPYFSDAEVHVAGKATVAASAVDFAGSVDSPLVAATVADGRYVRQRPDGQPTAGWLESVARLDVAANFPNLPALYAGCVGPSPLSITGGQLSARAKVSRDGNATTVRLTDVKGGKVSVQANQQPVLDSADASLAATLSLESTAAAPAQLATLCVADLHATLGPTDVSLPQPLVVSSFSLPTPSVSGAVRVAGPLGPAWQVAAAYAGLSTTAAGDYVLTQTLSPAAGKLHLAGGLTLSNLAVKQGDRVLLADPQATLTNDLDLDSSTHTLSANVLKFVLSSGAATLDAKGRLIDWQAARQLDQVRVDVEYDWAKLWPVLQPLLPPDLGSRLKDLKVAGQHHSTFDIRGALPPGADPLRTLSFAGTLSLASADLDTYSLRDLILPLTLQNAQLRTTYPDGQTAPAAKFNGGTLDLGNVTIDLSTAGVPRYTLPHNKVVLAEVKIDVPLASDLLAPYCPLFAGVREADGKLTLTVVDCTNLDPNELNNLGASARGQRLELLAAATDLRVAGAFTDTLQPLIDPPGFATAATVRDGHVTLQDGQAVNDFTVQLNPAGGSDVDLKGTVRLADRMLMPWTAAIAKKILPAVRAAGPAALANLPDKVELPFDGSAEHPQPRADALNKAIQDAAAKALTSTTPAAR